METSLLPRMAVPVAAPVLSPLGLRAKEILGYEHLEAVERDYMDETKLFDACVSAGVRPFQTAAVERYKADKARKRWYETFAVANLCWSGGLGIIGGSIIVAALSYPFFALFSLLGATSVIWAATHFDRNSKDRIWRPTLLQHFTDPVPEGVLQIAMVVKEQNKDVIFFVDELREQMRVIDPFLVVKLGKAKFYIARWDEPDFRAEYE